MPEPKRAKGARTIYDVADEAGVSIASVSRVLNGQGRPRAITRERVMKAVAQLGFVPDGAARALSNGLKEVVGVVFRRGDETYLEDEDESLLFIDVINRGIDIAAQRRGFDVLMSSVGFTDTNASTRITSLAGKADGLILHDRMLSTTDIKRLAVSVPIVSLAGRPGRGYMCVRCDNEAGMRALVGHLTKDHDYRSLGYVSGRSDSPDNLSRAHALEEETQKVGVSLQTGPEWQGNYSAAGGAKVISSLLDAGRKLPRAILCANDQTALGVMHALARRRIRVPDEVAVTGFDDVPVARHLHPPLTTIRQPMQDLGATAFDVLYSKISSGTADPDVVLTVSLIVRESCGCKAHQAPDHAANRRHKRDDA